MINLFPFLPLDGGHIFWALAEKVRGRADPVRGHGARRIVGFVLIMLLFVVGLTNDISTLHRRLQHPLRRAARRDRGARAIPSPGWQPNHREETMESSTMTAAGRAVDAATLTEALRRTAARPPRSGRGPDARRRRLADLVASC